MVKFGAPVTVEEIVNKTGTQPELVSMSSNVNFQPNSPALLT
jgi:hypothetical protein